MTRKLDFSVPEIHVTASDLLTPAQVAERLQVSAKTVREWLRDGRLPIPSLKLPGGGIRVRVEDLESYLVAQTEVDRS